MSKIAIALAAAALITFGAGAVGALDYTPPAGGQGFKQVERPAASITIWVGVLCKGGRMEVATTLKGLAPYDCRDRYSRTLLEKEVLGR